MDRGEIWLVSLDPIAGHEQSGKRPVLIVSKAAFNKQTRLPVVVPVTSGGNFARATGFTVSLDGVGTKTTGVLRCDQPRTIVMGARSGKRLERIPDAVVNEVLARLDAILS
ncbi:MULTISPECIES: type II toxin-antitoxin system PemK/MazF family toxin [Klebsiella]|uniref:Type II toxin-antitoxin system PemK/MazF family toxin n=1 Tax=Klebsiella variicola TaxID=244366 RepID=A0A2V3KRZ7_KLEVA|nr:type II toxin-antitoxin system PemK/MazF family toxin [Klebsiella variicola]ELA2927117.1 type II toxin-antitoxin system PemK/MazF family toxin [Klebsiella variicola]ELA2965290.1 type II toxin-antitoxin system PemK/MazF family toxin [Klebsiella variicola]KKY87620.1 pemk protein [Klebsiella variicola]MBG1746452.1 type II toxin-antitoxin system PemK/MazF family toxin [Klebsiella variicola]MBK4949691.1 type II toxin-antitoxin system PemK/MazF family toxin [Klebsiella variicola]